VTIRPARPDEAELLRGLAMRSKAHLGYADDFLAHCRAELSVSSEDGARRVGEAESASIPRRTLPRFELALRAGSDER
jgi:hypothetical protein